MKKIFTTIALFGLLAGGCSKTENISENNPNSPESGAEATTNYLSISIVSPSGANSRAEDKAPGSYEDGKGKETAVEDIRFYFFDADGKAAPVRRNPSKDSADEDGYDSFYDYNKDVDNKVEGDGDEDLTIEKTITVTMMLSIPDKDDLPKYVVAILNPTADALVNDNPDIEDLEGIVKDFLPGTNNLIMSNSVYADENQTKINWTEINGPYQSMDEAIKNPTEIFVERVVARIDLTVGKSTSSKMKPAKDNGYSATADATNVYFTGEYYKEYDQTDADKKPIFVKFLGWTVTSTPKKSYLLKDINPEWKADLFNKAGEPWNAATYFRSFWGINPTLTPANNATRKSADYNFYSYNDIAGDKKFSGNSMYILENAAEKGKDKVLAGHESKVIVAAQLVDKNGDPMPIAEYAFMYYKKNDLLQYFVDQLSTHIKDADGKSLSKDDITYVTQAAYKNEAGVDVPGGYYAYVDLTTTAKTKSWLIDGKAASDIEAIRKYIQGVVSNRLLIWENGQTYYYFEIEHLGNDGAPGYYGVVRNHIYKADISALTGLGTPVLDPNETIYPEKPVHDDFVLAAVINVLSWRVVSQDYEFPW